jgi:molybdopterin-containing oxidoreductase family iron-sulfur binding subunit
MTTLPRQWTSIEELAGDPAFAEKIAAEFPIAATFPPTARRDFLKIMAASFALAGLTGCGKNPFVAGIPYVDQPEVALPGVPRYYATAVTLDGYRCWRRPMTAVRPSSTGSPDIRQRKDAAMCSCRPPSFSSTIPIARRVRPAPASPSHGPTSPTLMRQIKEFQSQFPAARLHVHDASGEHERIANAVAAYGEPLDLHYQLDACSVVVSFDDDFLGPGPRQLLNAIKWAQARRRGDVPGIRLYCADSIPDATGAVASSRLRAAPSRMPHLVETLAARLGVAEASAADLSEEERRWLARAVAAVNAANGRALVTAGLGIGAQAARWAAQINDAIGATGRTLKLTSQVADPGVATASFDNLVTDMNAGQVDTLVILDANPVYTAPGPLDFAGALSKVKTSIHIGLYRDETGHRCTYQLPLTHDLESWSDARAVDGTATIIQPVITSFYDVRSRHQVMAMMLGRDEAADESLKKNWRDAFGESFDAKWKKALRDGFVAGRGSRDSSETGFGPDRASTFGCRQIGHRVSPRPDRLGWPPRQSRLAPGIAETTFNADLGQRDRRTAGVGARLRRRKRRLA